MNNRSKQIKLQNTFKFVTLVALMLQASSSCSAQTPTPANYITPFSWSQFKAVYGLPSTPTVPDNSAQIDTYNGTVAAANTSIVRGEQLRAYRIGNYGTTIPPSGANDFLDLEANIGDQLDDWAGPFYDTSTASVAPITVDDDNTLNSVTLSATGLAANSTTTVYGGFAESSNWTTVTAATAMADNTDNYYGDSYQIIPAVSRAGEDSTDNGVSPNYAHWVPYITTAGFYTVYAIFPSEQLVTGPDGVSPEPHVTDARYTIFIKLPGQQLNEYQVTVNQQGGGAPIALGPPHYFPQTSNDGQFPTPAPGDITYPQALPSGNSTNAFVDIRVDDTTAGPLTTDIGGTYYRNYIAADAIELKGGASRESGTPVAVNITPPILTAQASLTGATGSRGDYTEIALGYGAGSATGDGKTGGLPIKYQTDTKQTTGLATGSFFPATATDGVTAQLFNGSVGYNPALPAQPAELPIDQVVYFTRTETIQTDPNDAAANSEVGYVYAVNGQNGDVIWRFPSTAPDVIGDVDTNQFKLDYGTWAAGVNTSNSYSNEAYAVTSAVASPQAPTAAATWTPNALTTGNYFVYAYFPSSGNGENHVASAHYTINASNGNSYPCYVNQQVGGQWVQLQYNSGSSTTSTALFPLSNTSSVVLTNDTTDFTAVNSDNEVVCADAVEFVPEASMGTSDSTPAVVRNMKVYDQNSGTYIERTCVIVTDNLGKVYCLDASGNGDGDDTLYDANNLPVFINSAGQGFETYNAGTGVFSNPAPTPWHPLNYGTTSVYWIWQPNSASPISASETIDDSNATQTTFTGGWIPSATPITNAYLANEHTDASVPRAGTTFDDFVWEPVITGSQSGACKVFVNVGQNDGLVHADDARYTVVDDTGTAYQCNPVNQTTLVPGYVQLVATTGQSLFAFGASAAANANTVFLDNSTNDTDHPVLIADDVEFIFNGEVSTNNNLIPPQAFLTCSPTVHVVPDTSLTPASVTNPTTGTTIHYDAYDAKIYIGNSNGVLYALDGQGNPDGASAYQRDLSQDPNVPSPSVDWWFNVGLTTLDQYGNLEVGPNYVSEGIAGAPAYYHAPGNATTAYDQIMFTTYSPDTSATGGANTGNLYSVNAIGPVGDYGSGIEPDTLTNFATTYPAAAGTANYNLGPIPLFSFPDAYGTPHLPGTGVAIPMQGTDHIITSQVAPTTVLPNIIPPAHPLGNSAGSPTVFGGVTVPNPNGGASENLPYRAYFVADDPTVNGDPPTEGRVWGINLTPGSLAFGTVDALTGPTDDGVSSFIYPFPVPLSGIVPESSGGTFDPNTIAATDTTDISSIYDYNNTTGSTVTTGDNQQFGPFNGGPEPELDLSDGLYVSSSPAIGIVHTIPYTAGGNTLTPTLVGGPNPAGGNYPTEYGSATGAYDVDIPALYVGDLDSDLHTINVAGYSDDSRFLQSVLLDGSPIYSTPCLLANGNGATPFVSTDTGGNNVGGVVWTTTEANDLYESEALPFIESTAGITIARGVDYEYAGPGGVSSVSSASFNIDNFTFTASGNAASGDAGVDTSEWIYAGGDGGFAYGLTPSNTALGNGVSSGNSGGFNPGATINPTNAPVQPSVPQNHTFIVSVLTTNPIVNGQLTFSPTAGRPPENNVFDWGQTVYIAFYGLDDPNAGTGGLPAVATYPRGETLRFQISPQGQQGTGTVSHLLDLQAPGVAYKVSNWPPAPTGYTLETPQGATPTAAAPMLLGPYGAVYVYQLGQPSTSDPQTPGSAITITGINERVQYYSGVGAGATLVTSNIQGNTSPGSVLRIGSGNGSYSDVQTQPNDNATFSILNPLAIRSAGRSMGTNALGQYTYWPLTLVPAQFSGDLQYSLGPFSGADPAQFSTYQAADGNGNTIPLTAPLGGTIESTTGGTINPNDPTGSQSPANKTIDVTVAVSLGLINHGSTGISSTPNLTTQDPALSYLSSGDSTDGTPVYNPFTGGSGTYGVSQFGESLLDIGDRSALGLINQSLSTVTRYTSPNAATNNYNMLWNDNSGVGGAMAVVNPLPWEAMPTSTTTPGVSVNTSNDYPDIPMVDSSIEILPRTANYNIDTGPGVDSIITGGNGTLAAASPSTLANATEVERQVNPNAALIRVAVPRYQPANLESYNAATNVGVQSSGSTRLTSTANNVGQGYEQAMSIAVAVPGVRLNRLAHRNIQVWTSVPVDLSTKIVEQTIDIGSVPSGFGVDLSSNGSSANNAAWSPFNIGSNNSTASSALNTFYKPITILNIGNTNLINLHLNQFNYLIPAGTTALPSPVPNPFGSFGASAESIIPSFDNGGILTGTNDEPIVRSSLDFDLPNSGTSTNTYFQNAYEYQQNGLQPPPPGPTAHKPLVGDPSGAAVSVPDVPHNNLGSGSYNLNNLAYNGRPVVSIAVPIGTPVGQYSQTVSSFEGSDLGSSAYEGPIYGGELYTNNGWWGQSGATTETAPGNFVNGLEVNSSNQAYQTESNPSTKLTVNVVEDRATDGTPLPVTSSSGPTSQTVLPMTDAGATGVNINDLQPWAFYSPGTNGSTPSINMLWTSARKGSTAEPYSIYGSEMPLIPYTTNSSTSYLPSYPQSANGNSVDWWTPSNQLTEINALPTGASAEQSYDASTFSYGTSQYALWVTSIVENNSTVYFLNMASITNTNGQVQYGSSVTVFSSTEPIFSPRASFYSGANGALTGFTLNVTNPPALPSGLTTYPLIVYYTHVSGRSTLMYWPAIANVNGTTTVQPAAIQVPQELTSVATPTVVPRAYATATGNSYVDITFSGDLSPNRYSDICTGTYQVQLSSVGTAVLTPTATLPPAAITPTAPATLTLPTVTEVLTPTVGTTTWQARDIGWYRSTGAFQLNLQYAVGGAINYVALVPGNSTGTYDHASGQWVFSINWNNLISTYPSQTQIITDIANWWTGTANGGTAPNVVVYTKPGSGSVTFSTAPPTSNAAISLANKEVYQALFLNVDPSILRETFQSETNTAPISFIDDQYKTNAAPNDTNNVIASRYWYIYRKQTAVTTNSNAASSVLYYNTRRLTLVLSAVSQVTNSIVSPTPITLTDNNGVYSLPANFAVKDSLGFDVTSQVDVDWARGRIYFPELYVGKNGLTYSPEGATFTVYYQWTDNSSSTTQPTIVSQFNNPVSGTVTWEDEPLFNTASTLGTVGEHVLPINTPTNETEPSAFLDPNAGLLNGQTLTTSPSSVTPSSSSGLPYPHKVWVFWTSNRNAGTNGTGSDIYWETIDPRFEVINP